MQGRWALPVDGDPIEHAAVLIGADGRIAEVGPAARVPTPSDAESLELDSAILLPGLVNTHTHLELTGFEHTASELDFRRWILSIRRLKQERTPEAFLEAAQRGLSECWAGGVTTIADTGDSGAVIEVLNVMGGSGVVYHEVFGPHPDQAEESFSGLRRRVAELSRHAGGGGRVALGVSPHAPYTVSGPLYARVAEWARASGLPLAVHLAESRAEYELVSQGKGPFAEALAARGIELRGGGAEGRRGGSVESGAGFSPVGYLDRLGVLGPDVLCIHAIELDAADVHLLAASGAAVAHCPVSNAQHGHGTAPLAAFRAAGIRVGIGTDSVASVGPLDLFREARAAQAIAGLSDEQTLALATLDGARALGRGLEREIGSLTPGKWGDLIAVQPRATEAERSPTAAVLGAQPTDVLLTVLGGRIVWRGRGAEGQRGRGGGAGRT